MYPFCFGTDEFSLLILFASVISFKCFLFYYYRISFSYGPLRWFSSFSLKGVPKNSQIIVFTAIETAGLYNIALEKFHVQPALSTLNYVFKVLYFTAVVNILHQTLQMHIIGLITYGLSTCI